MNSSECNSSHILTSSKPPNRKLTHGRKDGIGYVIETIFAVLTAALMSIVVVDIAFMSLHILTNHAVFEDIFSVQLLSLAKGILATLTD